MSDFKYNAFISYRHDERDIKVAREIQQQLERFVIPTAIQQKTGKKKIERIFKDQEELGLTDDLSQQLEENLKNSEYLIVICSPSYLQSKWCLQEVENFLKYSDHDHVICVLAAGEPPAVFPPALMKQKRTLIVDGREETVEEDVEPLAADYRGDFRQARKVELPRIAASLIGCSYDELVMRQERYRRRKLMTVLTGVIIAAVIAVSYLLWSNAQISRNYRQSLINESRVLSGNSVTAMNDMNRYEALSSALLALPSEDNDRPVIDEAQFAASLASYAYQTPYRCLETWCVDQVADIIDYFISRDGNSLVCLNRDALVTVYGLGTGERYSSFKLDYVTVPDAIEEGKSGTLICFLDGFVCCYDYRKGELLWKLGLNFMQFGTAHLSHDGKYIGAADSLAVQVMTAEGKPCLSLPLPKDYDGYVVDFIWSADDRYIGLLLRSNGKYQIGWFEFDTSRFHVYDDEWARVDEIFYDSQGILHVVADNGIRASGSYKNRVFVMNDNFILTAYQMEKKLYGQELSVATLIGSFMMEETLSHDIVLTIGNQVFLIDGQGKIIYRHTLPDEIVGILECDPRVVSLALYSGEYVMLDMTDGSSIRTRQFAKNCTAVEMLKSDSYLIVNSGNLQIYENICDDSLQYFDSTFHIRAEGYYVSEKTLGFICSRAVYLYDRQTRERVATVELDKNDGYHYLDSNGSQFRVLRINSQTGAMSVCFYDMESGEMLKQRELGIREFHVANGYLSAPMTEADSTYLDYYYSDCSSMYLQDGILYLHQQNDAARFVVYDMNNDRLEEIKASIPQEYSLLDSTYLQSPSAIAVSPDGRELFTYMRKQSDGEMKGIIIDLQTGDYREVVQGTFSEKLFAWKDYLLILKDNMLEALTDSGAVAYQIPMATEQPLALDVHEGQLICMFAGGSLQTYRDGRLVKTVNLHMSEEETVSDKTVSFSYQGNTLYVLWINKLAAVNLDSESTTPLYTVPQGALGYLADSNEILVYAVRDDMYSSEVYPAVYRQYSLEELLERASGQLRNFKK